MCSKKYLRGLALLLLLSLASSPLYSDDAGEILTECMTRLEITTNELESATSMLIEYQTLIARQSELIVTYRSLTSGLMSSLTERDRRLRAIESSLRDTEQSVRGEIRRAWVFGGAVGLTVGVLVSVLLAR